MRVIFLHGNVGTGSDWDPVVSDPALMDHSCEAPVLWEYFRTRRHHSLQDWADWFCGTIRPGKRPLIVGYSLGGRLALHAVVRHAELFAGVVIVSGHTGLVASAERAKRSVADKLHATMAAFDWDQFLDCWERQAIFDSSERLPNRAGLGIWSPEISSAFEVWSLGSQEDLAPRLADIHCPILWITGSKDERFTEIGKKASRVAHARHFAIDGAGHRVPMDQPAALAKHIAAFASILQ